MSDTPLFVVVLTGNGDASFSVAPRAIGPFEDFDVAQAFTQTLPSDTAPRASEHPTATVVRVESDQPGVVMGEM